MFQTQVITDLATEPVTLSEMKVFMSVDYSDWDTLITTLIKAARVQSENVTGKAYGPKVIEVTGNSYTDRTGCIQKVYPILPFVSDVDWVDSDGNVSYRYNSGYAVCPPDLKIAIMMRVATGFAYRQNALSEAVNQTINASIITELQYKSLLAI